MCGVKLQGGEGDEKDFEQSQRMLASYEIIHPWQLPYWETRLLAHIVEFIRPFSYATSGHIFLRKEVKAFCFTPLVYRENLTVKCRGTDYKQMQAKFRLSHGNDKWFFLVVVGSPHWRNYLAGKVCGFCSGACSLVLNSWFSVFVCGQRMRPF